MPRAFRLRCLASMIIFLALLVGVGSWLLLAGKRLQPRLQAFAQLTELRPTGYPQLVSIEPLPEMDGEMCEWVPASSTARLLAARQQERQAVPETRTSVALERPPVRVIRDPFPAYTAVAVDVKNSEIVLQDENLFQIIAYDRMTNTPPTASMSEPKRVIGGLDTQTEFNCGLYVDPKTGDIYTVSNDTLGTMSVFSRNARGNVRPDRTLRTPGRSWAIAVDEANEELFLAVQDPPMVVVHHKYAKGKDQPIRVLRGNKTGLGDAHGISLDTKHGWIFVANHGAVADYRDEGGNGLLRGDEVVPGSGRYELPSITVYPIKASGNAPPLRTIQGPKTLLNWPSHLSVDEQRGEVFVANDVDDSVLVFHVTDSGDVAPTRVLKGPKTQLKNPVGVFVDIVNDELVVANMGNHRATVYRRTAQGDTPPIRTIRAGPEGVPALKIGNPGSVAYDTKRDQIIVPN